MSRPSGSQAAPALQHPQAGLWLIASDAQIPFHSEEALEVFFAAVKALQPVGVILAGDWIDGRTISSHVKNPHDTRSLQDEIDIAQGHLQRLAAVPTKVWLGSNHCDARLARYLATKAPELACLPGLTIPKLLGLDDAGWGFYPYGQPFERGDALCLHGHKISQHSGQSALKHVQQYHKSVIHGHCHRAGHTFTRTHNGQLQGVELGCMCRLNPDYIVGLANWINAFAAAMVEPDGHTSIQLLPIQADGSVMFGREKVNR
jgi:hypothetical protein